MSRRRKLGYKKRIIQREAVGAILDPRHLVQLAEIIRCGSISRASASLGVPAANLSRNMAALEARLGAPVLETGHFGARATEIGRALAVEGRRIQAGLERAEGEYSAWRGGMHGRLRLGVGTFIAYALMPHFLADPLLRDWKVALTVEVSPAGTMLSRVLEGELDAAFTHVDPADASAGLRIVPMFDERCGFYVARTHPLARRGEVRLADLSAQPFVTAGAFFALASEAFRAEGIGVPFAPLSFHGDVSIALQTLARGEHVAALPDFLMSRAPDSDRFVRLPVPWVSPMRQVAVSLRAEAAGAPLLEDFLKRLRAFLGDLGSIRN